MISSYIDAKQIGNEIYIAEQLPDGDVKIDIKRAPYIAYEEDRNGTYTSITGKKLRKIRFKSRKEIREAKGEGRLLWESDISPTFRYLETAYPDDGKLPNLRITIYDIEVDRDPERGFSTTRDPFNPLTSITVYHKWKKQAITIAVPPPEMSMEEAIALVNDTNHEDGYGPLDESQGYFLVHTEAQLLELFIEIIQESQILSGWNCIDKNESLWLENKIIKLNDVKIKNITATDGEVVNVGGIESKTGNKIITKIKSSLIVSDVHRIPISIKQKHKYKNSISIEKECLLTASEMYRLLKDNDLYVKIPKHNNLNKRMKFRDVLMVNLDEWIQRDDFDIILCREECKLVKKRLKDIGCLDSFFSVHQYTGGEYPNNCPNFWKYKRLRDFISMDELFLMIAQNRHLRILRNKHTNIIDLDKDVSDEQLQILGLIFTDGSVDWKKYVISIYSSDPTLRNEYTKLIQDCSMGTGSWGKQYRRNSRTRVSISSEMYFLLSMIYYNNKKSLNVELLSRLSYGQFCHFISGVIDGDGTISGNSFSICNYENQLPKLQELLLWNGTISSLNANGCNLRILQTKGNVKIMENLSVFHTNKIPIKFKWLNRNSGNKLTNLYDCEHCWWSKIDHIERIGISEMMDIETESHYFISKGIKVHNCSGYDLPYLIGRIRIVLGGESIDEVKTDFEFNPSDDSRGYLQRLCAFPVLPEAREIERFGNTEIVYELSGRRDVDYLIYYKKFVKAEVLNFTLDGILQLEVGQTKVHYDGTIDQFYRREFRRFLAYNRQDVMGLSAIDDKRKLINLANQMIHMSGVTMDKAVGSVTIIEQAILRELHRERGEIAWDKQNQDADANVPGAFVVEPTAGLYGWGGSYDVNSLYPTMIRLLNISPETMIGQLKLFRTEKLLNQYVDDILGIPVEDRVLNFSHRRDKNLKAVDQAYTEAWHKFTGVLEYHDVINGSDNLVSLEKIDHNSVTMTGKEMRKILLSNNWCITANGTVFTLEKEGIIPFCLTKWYNERTEYQKKARDYENKALALRDKDPIQANECSMQYEYYNMIQDSKKRFLNSTYGAYLNRYFRFYDPRCGRSVTLSGRVVVKHMCKKSCEILSNEYNFIKDVLLSGDTDSTYISYENFMEKQNIPRTLENAIAIGDMVGDIINESFVEHLSTQFLIPKERINIVKVKRETIYDRAIFKNEKKRYALHVVDKEGKKIPKGHKEELKIVGLEVKRSDTPKYIAEFLQECLRLVLVEGYVEDELRTYIDEFRTKFRQMPPWKIGSPVRVNKLQIGTKFMEDYEGALERHEINVKKPKVYWAVMAAANTNKLITEFNEPRWDKLHDGDKIEVLFLKENKYNIERVAIRVGEDYIPEWFKELPFDNNAHEKKQIDQKLQNIFGGLGWEFEERNHTGWEIFS